MRPLVVTIFVDKAENATENIWWILEGQDYPRNLRAMKRNRRLSLMDAD